MTYIYSWIFILAGQLSIMIKVLITIYEHNTIFEYENYPNTASLTMRIINVLRNSTSTKLYNIAFFSAIGWSTYSIGLLEFVLFLIYKCGNLWDHTRCYQHLIMAGWCRCMSAKLSWLICSNMYLKFYYICWNSFAW